MVKNKRKRGGKVKNNNNNGDGDDDDQRMMDVDEVVAERDDGDDDDVSNSRGTKVKKSNRDGIDEEHLLRVLVFTDPHLGFHEKDPIRADDSFRAFDECMSLAKKHKVDFVLLGGDLFHENRPSRHTMYKTTKILSEYCLGDDPIKFQVVSDQAMNFPDTGCVNFESPNYNIGLPVFSIHGNHDDPSGPGHMSAMDLLSVSSLVNYFGKAENVDDIRIAPVLLQKGDTKLAMYGLGAIRDERLHRTFRNNKVKWLRPVNTDDWFNLFVIHQNRTKHTSLSKNFISEEVLPKFLDFIIWGHEHECRIEPERNEERDFDVSQPGSTVHTSLSQGEAVPKCAGLLEVCRDQYRIVPIPLKSVRPFVIRDLVLSRVEDLDPNDHDQIRDVLEEEVNSMIAEALGPSYNPGDHVDDEKLPLIRLRVDYSDFERLDIAHRFGQLFVGRVANPQDLLTFFKRRKAAGPKNNNKDLEAAMKSEFDLIQGGDVDNAPPIHDIVTQFIEQHDNLTVLRQNFLADAVRDFVEKHDLDAIEAFVNAELQLVQDRLCEQESVVDADSLHEALDNISIKEAPVVETKKKKKEKAAAAKKKKPAATKRGRRKVVEIDSDEDDDDDSDGDEAIVPLPKSRKAPASNKRKAAAAASTRKRAAPATKRKAATTRKKAAPKASPAVTRTRASRRGTARTNYKESDSDEGDDDDEDEEEEDDDDDDDDFVKPSSVGFGKRKRR